MKVRKIITLVLSIFLLAGCVGAAAVLSKNFTEVPEFLINTTEETVVHKEESNEKDDDTTILPEDVPINKKDVIAAKGELYFKERGSNNKPVILEMDLVENDSYTRLKYSLDTTWHKDNHSSYESIVDYSWGLSIGYVTSSGMIYTRNLYLESNRIGSLDPTAQFPLTYGSTIDIVFCFGDDIISNDVAWSETTIDGDSIYILGETSSENAVLSSSYVTFIINDSLVYPIAVNNGKGVRSDYYKSFDSSNNESINLSIHARERKVGEIVDTEYNFDAITIKNTNLTYSSLLFYFSENKNLNPLISTYTQLVTFFDVSKNSYSGRLYVYSQPSFISMVSISNNTLNLDLNDNRTATLTASVIGENNPSQSIIWTSTNSNIVSVSDSGLITALREGNATIRATSAVDSSKCADCYVTVDPQIVATGITLSANSIELDLNSTNSATITAVVNTTGTSPQSLQKVTWSTTDSSVVEITSYTDTTCTISGVTTGTAQIRASGPDYTQSSCYITVTENPVVPTQLGRYKISFTSDDLLAEQDEYGQAELINRVPMPGGGRFDRLSVNYRFEKIDVYNDSTNTLIDTVEVYNTSDYRYFLRFMIESPDYSTIVPSTVLENDYQLDFSLCVSSQIKVRYEVFLSITKIEDTSCFKNAFLMHYEKISDSGMPSITGQMFHTYSRGEDDEYCDYYTMSSNKIGNDEILYIHMTYDRMPTNIIPRGGWYGFIIGNQYFYTRWDHTLMSYLEFSGDLEIDDYFTQPRQYIYSEDKWNSFYIIYSSSGNDYRDYLIDYANFDNNDSESLDQSHLLTLSNGATISLITCEKHHESW